MLNLLLRWFSQHYFIRICFQRILKLLGTYSTNNSTISNTARSFIDRSSTLTIDSSTNIVKFREDMNEQVKKISDTSYNNNIEIAYELDINGVRVLEVLPFDYDNDANLDSCCIFLHGGGYVFGDVDHCHTVSAPIIFYSGLKTYMVNYSKAPENPFPKGLEDCIEVYIYLVDELGYNPKNICMFGASSGASLCASMLFELKRLGYGLPKKLALLSPWADINKIGDSYFSMEGFDPIISFDLNLKACQDMYLSFNQYTDNHGFNQLTDEDNNGFGQLTDEDKDAIMKDPLISPVYGDYTILNEEKETEEPMQVLITSGTRDLFLSNCVRLHQQMKKGGINSILDIKEGMWHVYQIYGIPEGDESAREIGEFLKNI